MGILFPHSRDIIVHNVGILFPHSRDIIVHYAGKSHPHSRRIYYVGISHPHSRQILESIHEPGSGIFPIVILLVSFHLLYGNVICYHGIYDFSVKPEVV